MTDVYMPRLSDTMEEGVISSWRKQVGDKVSPGDVLVDIETDKAVMEYEAYEEGYLVALRAAEGDTVPIGEVIAVLGDSPDAEPAKADADAADTAAPEDTGTAAASERTVPEQPQAPAAERPQPAASTAEEPTPAPRPRSSPLARRLAREYGLDIERISGSGPKGRVVRADIEAAAAQRAEERPAEEREAPAAPAPEAPAPIQADDGRDSEEVGVSNVRKVTARRLSQSKQEAPHFYLRRTIDAEALRAFRAEVNERLADTGGKVSVNDLIVKAVATVLRKHPQVNSSWVADRLLRHRRINVGVAVAVEAGLVVPVIRDVDKTGLSEIAQRSRELAAAARDGNLSPQDMSGGTFTVSNLGMFDVDSFSAVINPPEAAILAVGAMRRQPVVRDEEIVARNTIALELSVDHRAVDGATAAEFFKELAEVLEEPMRIIL